jgi:hypothetical protein
VHKLSQVLDVPVSFFFDDPDPARAPTMDAAESLDEVFDSDPLRKPETIELVQAYFSIESATVRQRFRDLVKAIASK